jgi:hypothetical protein
MTRPRFAAPALGQRLGVHNARAEFARDFRGAIGGGVVHDDDFARTDGLVRQASEAAWGDFVPRCAQG